MSDREPPGFTFDLSAEPFDRVLWTTQLPIQDIASWIFKHNLVEMCAAVKGPVLKLILDEGADVVLCMDPSVALFSPLDLIIEALATQSIVLTPQLIWPENNETAVWEDERSSQLPGPYNLGFVAVKNSAEGRRFAHWWHEPVADCCYDEPEKGSIHIDQRWCDLGPAFFDQVQVLRDPGCNVASWTFNKRPMRFDAEGQIFVEGAPLRFYQFNELDPDSELRLERYSGTSPVPFELVEWYRQATRRNAHPAVPPSWWAYERYSDGTFIEQADRTLYRSQPDLTARFPDPFAAEGYLAWLRAQGYRA